MASQKHSILRNLVILLNIWGYPPRPFKLPVKVFTKVQVVIAIYYAYGGVLKYKLIYSLIWWQNIDRYESWLVR